NLAYDFKWDGKDAYGRAVEGQMRATIHRKYIYFTHYYGTTQEFDDSFAQFGDPNLTFTTPVARFFTCSLGYYRSQGRAPGAEGQVPEQEPRVTRTSTRFETAHSRRTGRSSSTPTGTPTTSARSSQQGSSIPSLATAARTPTRRATADLH